MKSTYQTSSTTNRPTTTMKTHVMKLRLGFSSNHCVAQIIALKCMHTISQISTSILTAGKNKYRYNGPKVHQFK